MNAISEFTYIQYETPEPGIARIWLNRAETANAHNA